MIRVAFATCDLHPDGIADDDLALEPLSRRGIEVARARWSDARVDWSEFAAVIPRNTWDYTERFPAFQAWLRALPVPVWNPVPVLLWNARKTYLQELEARGVRGIPTARLAPGEDLGAAMDARGWADCVVKPVVSAGARGTFRVQRARAAELGARVAALGEDMLLQPFVPEIVRGEWSLIYFDGAFSHALLKRPKPGDFRVQEKHGGEILAERAPAELVDHGLAVLEAIGEPLLYARIDLVRGAEGPLLVEAELIEPELFLRVDPAAPERLAEALARRL